MCHVFFVSGSSFHKHFPFLFFHIYNHNDKTKQKIKMKKENNKKKKKENNKKKKKEKRSEFSVLTVPAALSSSRLLFYHLLQKISSLRLAPKKQKK